MIPDSQKQTLHSGHFSVPSKCSIQIAQSPEDLLTDDDLITALQTFVSDGIDFSASQTPPPSPAEINFARVAVDELPTEAYRLAVTENAIRIDASCSAGWYYGATTLSWLLHEAITGDRAVACQTIEDHPQFRWRGMHLDVCRHFFDVAFIKRFLDLMAMHKFNRFHWHLTEDQGWRIEIPSRPELQEISAWRIVDGEQYGGYYTHDEIREVVEYARRRCIEIVPEIETPGHSLAVLASYPELACQPKDFAVETEWGIFDDVYCAGNDATFEFLEEVIDIVVDLFPGPIVHVGGDECPKTRWKECPKCQSRIKAEGLRDEDHLQSWFISRMVQLLQSRGRQAIGWDEILEGGLADGAMVMSWRGHEGGIAAAKLGHDVVMSPTDHCYFDYWQSEDKSESGFHGVNTLRDVFDFEPVPEGLSSDQASHIQGGQGNVWTERMTSPAEVEYMILPRMCALAEVLWTGERRSWDDFNLRLQKHIEFLAKHDYGFRPLQ